MAFIPAELAVEVAVASQALDRRVVLTYDAPGVNFVVDALLKI